MATEGQGSASQAPALTSLPRVEDLPGASDGFDREKVREAFEAFRRHTTQLQVQLRVLQAAGQSGQVEATGHAVRMDALHMIRAAAEMADTIERDAQTASAAQLRRTEEEVTRRQRDLQERRGRGRPLPPGERAPARRDDERRQERVPPDAAGGPAGGDAGDRGGRGSRRLGCSSRRATRRPSSRTRPAPRSSRRSSGLARRPA